MTRAAVADNIAVFTQYIAVMGNVEDEIVECFKKGGGVPYEKFPRFHAVVAEDSGQTVLSWLESHILPLVPGLSDRLAKGIRMLDAGCGSGRIMNRLAELYPNSRFTGMDLSSEAIGYARGEASQKGLRNTEFIVQDLSDFDQTAEPEAFDLVHNNIGHPAGTFLYAVSTTHCMTVSLAQGGEGLGTMWGEEKTRQYLQKAGFRSIETNQLAHDVMNNWYVVRK